jgi:hypothetical protein
MAHDLTIFDTAEPYSYRIMTVRSTNFSISICIKKQQRMENYLAEDSATFQLTPWLINAAYVPTLFTINRTIYSTV